jgi:uncharacterized membrane protein
MRSIMALKHIGATRTRSVSPWLLALMLLLGLALLVAFVSQPTTSLLDRLRWLVSGICAQMPTHSFYPGGLRLPLCARNSGIYLGFSVTFIVLSLGGRGRAQKLPKWPIIAILACGVAALTVDGLNSFASDLGLPHLYQPQNLLRLATGLITGGALVALSMPLMNRLLWGKPNEQRSIASWRALLLLTSLLLLCFCVTASQSALALYPLALLSTTGVLAAVSNVNLMIIVAVCRREETFMRYRDLLPFLTLALLCGVGELLLLAQFRLLLSHILGLNA